VLAAPASGSDAVPGAPLVNLSGVDLELSAVAVVPQGVLIADDELVGSALFVRRAALEEARAPVQAAARATVVKLQRRRKDSEPNSTLPRLFAVQDLEGMAASDDGETVYLVGSHAPTKGKQHRRTDREFLVKARWRADEPDLRVDAAKPGGVPGIYRRLIDDLQGQVTHTGPGGFNVEGLALRAGTLHIGLRAPLSGGESGNALIFSAPEEALFGAGSERFTGPFSRLELDLSGAGVRGLHWDEATGKLLILSGPTADGGDAPRALWSYDFGSKVLTREHGFSPEQLRELGNPEGVARLDTERLIIVFDHDDAARASMMLMAWP